MLRISALSLPSRRLRDLQQFFEHATFVSICNSCPHTQHVSFSIICPHCTICLHLQHLTAPAQFYRLRSDFLLPPQAFPQRLVYPGRPRPALATPMAWHYSWHLIFFSFAVSCFFLHFPSDAISSSTYIRPRFSGPRRCVCSIVSWGLITAGTPTARCTRGG